MGLTADERTSLDILTENFQGLSEPNHDQLEQGAVATKPTRLPSHRPSIVSEALRRIDWTYMPGDHMLGPSANHHHYREVGQSAIHCIYAAILLANTEMPRSVLDFGCGSGRITRWLKAVFPSAEISASDLRRDSLEFLAAQFGVKTWLSSPSPSELQAPRSYDLIWSGSVITHLTEENSKALIAKFYAWLEPGGVAVFTTHGRRMVDNMLAKRLKYMDPELESGFLNDLARVGYAYAPYKNQPIGVSANTRGWIVSLMEAMGGRLVTFSENAWDKHQDVIAIQKPI